MISFKGSTSACCRDVQLYFTTFTMPVRTRADLELMPIHYPIPGIPPLKWECEAQIETQDIDDVASDYSQGPFVAFVLLRGLIYLCRYCRPNPSPSTRNPRHRRGLPHPLLIPRDMRISRRNIPCCPTRNNANPLANRDGLEPAEKPG